MAEANLSFSEALNRLKNREKVCRAGWNGKGMWLKLIPFMDWTVTDDHIVDVDGLRGLPWIGMKTADDCFVPWLASQTDMLAEDWMVCRG